MNGARGSAVKQILQAIENGTLPTDDTQRRLMGLIQQEANRVDGPADQELISGCLDLIERLQGREQMDDEERIAALNRRIAVAIKNKERHQERARKTAKVVGIIAAVLVLIVGIGVPIRWTWFEDWSTPDEQQHVIMGHEITVDMVANAIAENETTEHIMVSDFSEFEKHLGFDPEIPDSLGKEWMADYGLIRYFPGYIRIIATYKNAEMSGDSLTCTINYFTDIEYAYFSFEQNAEGEKVSFYNTDMYLSNNIERNSATWYNENMYARVVGKLSADELAKILVELIGGKDD